MSMERKVVPAENPPQKDLAALYDYIKLVVNDTAIKELKEQNRKTVAKIMEDFEILYKKLQKDNPSNSARILLGFLFIERGKLHKENEAYKLLNSALPAMPIDVKKLDKKPHDKQLFFKERKMDFQKGRSKKSGRIDKPLSKPLDRFKKTVQENIPQYGGFSSLGFHQKAPKKKGYFLARHKLHGYFAIEIFNLLGIFTPKTRIIEAKENKEEEYFMASKAVANFIPIAGVRHDVKLEVQISPFLKDPEKKKLEEKKQLDDIKKTEQIRSKYKLDIARQIILDRETGVECKISGNLFGSDMAATLVTDKDLQPHKNNLGFVRLGDRFYTVAIDKDMSIFMGVDDYEDLYQGISTIRQDVLFKNKPLDQTLFIVDKISEALKPITLDPREPPLNAFQRIFLNQRVNATPLLAEQSKELLENILKDATLIVKAHEKHLAAFRAREIVREKIAEGVLEKIPISSAIDRKALRKIIIEDLRGPYYQHLFKNKALISKEDLKNSDLVDAVFNDLANEFRFLPKEVLIRATLFGRSNLDAEAANKINECKDPFERYRLAVAYIKNHSAKDKFAANLNRILKIRK